MPSGLVSPAHSAIDQQFLRGRSDSSPSTKSLTRRRGSTREPARNPAHRDLERLLPAGRVYAVTRGHHKIFSLHPPMISGGRTRQSADLY
jgi:hypothetical protein